MNDSLLIGIYVKLAPDELKDIYYENQYNGAPIKGHSFYENDNSYEIEYLLQYANECGFAALIGF